MRAAERASCAVGLLAVLALAGCSPAAPLAAAPAVTESVVPPSTAAVTGGPTPSPAPLLPEEQTRGLESTPWKAVRSEGRALTIEYVAGGGCPEFTGIRLEETDESVQVWTMVRTDDGAQACALFLSVGATELRLTRPLGSRALLHPPVSEQWQSYVGSF